MHLIRSLFRSLQVDDYAHGRVALKVQLLNQHLRVEILNASELRPPEIHRGKQLLDHG